ncbi:hypothetical protein GOARA_091_00150 [Gordonia araii NBRC 100433]|uniref:Uncharacterized protein n=1 Tax=Gordonia araii NBRC 100433 TaxID=1073574 RepID=G7H7S2_9ACTN|nr:hypothetical protein [Gordonia araii]NNG95662.1 hypothetical protein [Gordonia araii NBRC 100433]GAB11897.1 hypothetical protein GOARA_091_00150 [Gordonia araii NBRC 100433]
MPKSNESAELAARLLDAHVAFEVRKLLDPVEFEKTVVDEVDNFLGLADELTLAQAISSDPVKAVARKYAAQIPVEGAIPELVGEIARLLYRNAVNDEYRLSDVIDDRHFDELATAIGELGVTKRVLRRVFEGPSTIDTAVEVVTRAVDSVLDDPESVDEVPASDPVAWLRDRAARGLRTAVRPARPAIDSAVEKVTRSGAAFVLRSNEDEAQELLVDSVRDVWRNHREDSVGVYREVVTEEDIDDIVVLVFEFWREFRDTEFLQTLLDQAIDYVFEKYGDTPLSELLGELGVFREDLVEEALRFGPPVLERLHERGHVEPLVRRRFAAFYASEEFQAALG